jgi:hypothetical protein
VHGYLPVNQVGDCRNSAMDHMQVRENHRFGPERLRPQSADPHFDVSPTWRICRVLRQQQWPALKEKVHSMCSIRVHSTEPFQSLTQCFGHTRNQARKWSITATWIVLVSLPSALHTRAQSISFFGAFNSYSQTIVAFPQGIVADGSGNLYLSGTVNLTYVPVDASGDPQTASEFHIDLCCGNAYGLAIDNENNLYRPDIANASASGDSSFPGMTGTCGVAKYTYNSLNHFSKSCIGTGWVHPSSVAVDSSLNVYVLEA